MSWTDPEVDRDFAVLRTEYVGQLAARAREVAAAAEAARAAPGDIAALAAAQARALKLRGTSGAYGFPEVSAAAARVEELIAATIAALAIPDATPYWKRVDAACAELEAAARAVVMAEEAARAATQPDAPTMRRKRSYFGGSRVLVVDSDPEFLGFVEEVGKRQLFEIAGVRTAEDAIERAKRLPLDVAFIDAKLGPGGDAAFALARELRGHADDALPLGFLSVDDTLASRVAAAHAGASLFLAKPVDGDAFGNAVRQLVGLRQVARPSVLIVDRDEAEAARIATVLRQTGMMATVLTEPEGFLGVLEDTRPDLVLLDVVLDGLSGLDLCRTLRTAIRWQDVPIIFITAETGVETRLAAFKAGGDDYLVKPIVNEELLARIQVRLDRARLLRERADRDALTGLMLRRAFMEGLGARLSEARRYGRPLTLCLLDLDKFKRANDTHGHLAGDRVLAGLGKLLASRFRAEDLRCRWGGEEFVLAFPGTAGEPIQGALSRVLGEFSELSFHGDKGESFRMTFSAGMATFPADGDAAPQLLERADRRLYAAKRAGGNRVLRDG
ncbi:MAG TPA: diguanylate cyclase [Planctomycetota bacterium]|nr:diguanylate cyclase [Planctomycetota bacterium]